MLAKPPPIGVVTGPLSPTWVRSRDSVSSFGMYSLYFSNASAPAMKVSHSNFTPVASRMRTVAWVTSGPMPSPGMRVILCVIISIGASCRDVAPQRLYSRVNPCCRHPVYDNDGAVKQKVTTLFLFPCRRCQGRRLCVHLDP